MALKIECDFCGKELDKTGAILISPPEGEFQIVMKEHICRKCWHIFYLMRKRYYKNRRK